jgi:hypothetical protein
MLPYNGPDALEGACARALGPGFIGEPHRCDFRQKDNSWGIEVKAALRSLRDFRAAAVQLALHACEQGAPHRLALAVFMPHLSVGRLTSEWEAFCRLLRPELARKLGLMAIGHSQSAVVPSQEKLRSIAEKLAPVLRAFRLDIPPSYPRLPSDRFFEVFKAVLVRWLDNPNPLTIKSIIGITGASYTSVSQSLRRLEHSHELKRHPSGAVELEGFPWTTWSEITALLQPLRKTRHYKDATGRGVHPMALYQGVRKLNLPHVAVGGTLAAVKRDARFDLHGLPRLDLSVLSRGGVTGDDLVRAVHPSLRPCEPDAGGVVIAVHPLERRQPFFEPDKKKGVRWADEVEMLLDLYELRLVDQAQGRIRALVDRRDRKPDAHP